MERSKFEEAIRYSVQHYNPKKYWKRRNEVVNPNSGKSKLKRVFWLFYIKRCDAFNNATLGTQIGYGASFVSEPYFPHGLYGIIITPNAKIGSNCIIYHNVTIGEGKDGAPTIGNNVTIGANSCVVGGISVGNNVYIGAGTTVYKDVPDNATVISNEMKIILHDNKE